ncbi:MAG: DegT/DnrJ/EryC1/StrS family aminotransferase [Caldilineaceae bacterium]|nr:DegT/DnrJ/EryC1/StrS family aminotransferase [Caldilineaceae bacterium]
MTLNPIQVPFVDLGAQHLEVRSEIDAVMAHVVDTSSFIGGPLLAKFEANFAQYCGVTQAIGVSDGTHALQLALRAIGVTHSDLVLTVSHTFIATAEAIVQCGAEPVFLEIDPETYTLSPHALAAWLEAECLLDENDVCRYQRTNQRVVAIVPVHLYGLPADMEPILAIAERYHLRVVEDACQAHGAWYKFSDGRQMRAGSMGDVGCFSFYPGKNLGAMGEAGAVVTNDPDLAHQVRILRDHGQNRKYIHQTRYGINARLDALQAGILDIKLARLDRWNHRRREIAAYYDECLGPIDGIQIPRTPDCTYHVYHLYVILLDQRDLVQQQLQALGISTGLHYPTPVHLQEAFADQGYQPGDLPITERVAHTLLSLPMFPHMSDSQVEYVVTKLRQVRQSL